MEGGVKSDHAHFWSYAEPVTAISLLLNEIQNKTTALNNLELATYMGSISQTVFEKIPKNGFQSQCKSSKLKVQCTFLYSTVYNLYELTI